MGYSEDSKMKLSSLIITAFTLAQNWAVTFALFEEEAGVHDFVVATAGHGATQYVHAPESGSNVLTSDSPQDAGALANDFLETSCIVSSRDTLTGSLLWRRNVCSSRSSKPQHVVTANDDFLYTMDHAGIVRAWTMDKGALAWDASAAEMIKQPRIWAVSNVVASTSNLEALELRDAKTGSSLSTVMAGDALNTAKVKGSGKEQALWLHVMPDDSDAKVLKALVAWVSTNKKNGHLTSAGASMALVEMHLDEGGVSIGSTYNLKHSDRDILVSSLKVQYVHDEWHAIALSADQMNVVQFSLSSGFAQVVSLSQLHSRWTSLQGIMPSSQSGMMGLVGQDNHFSPPRSSMGLFRYNSSDGWSHLYSVSDNENPQFDAIAYCPSMELAVALQRDQGLSIMAWQVDTSSIKSIDVFGDSSLAISDPVTSLTVLSCQKDSLTALASTTLGTTMQLTFTQADNGVSSNVLWTAEEGLAKVSSALLLDASHSPSVVDALSSEQEEETLRQLHVSSRLKSQWEALTSLSRFVGDTTKNRDYGFGFIKVAVLLSQASHRLWGMDTFGDTRGKLRWTIDLPPMAEWHTIIHGTSSSATAVHGGNGGTHSREVLVLSSLDDRMEWSCVDGTTGTVHASGSVQLPSQVIQVVPLYMSSSHGSTSCRQTALLLHNDNSVSVLPDDDAAHSAAAEQLGSSTNGLYSHVLNHEQSASMESLQIVSSPDDSSTMTTRVVGQTSFPGERVVGVAYPQRDEVVQSPSSVLGDDSLLLKYLNPHLAAVVTMSDSVDTDSDDDFSAAMTNPSGSTKKRKPLGVTQAGESAQTTTESDGDAPNLFVNVVDTVSGRVLYRASHSNAAPSDNVPVLVNENWIIYSYFNDKTRRTELGVLSLYEGMIDKKGLTAFSAPEQALSFSSMNARESKPVVLSKTYGLAKTVTALGVTSTRGGISAKQVLVASGDDSIMAIDRRFLEPRRPTGEVKEHEKLEGLRR